MTHNANLLTLKEAAAYLHVTTRTLQTWVAARQIPHRRLPVGQRHRIRFVRAELDAWLQRGE